MRSIQGGSFLVLKQIFKAVIIPYIIYKALVWYTTSGKQGHSKAFVAQLAQIQVLGTRLIIRVFKAISTQALNIETYLTLIGLELYKKVYQTAACLQSGSLYLTITQSRSTHLRQSLTLLEILEKHYTKLLGSNIQELKKRPVYILAPWQQSLNVNIASSKKKLINYKISTQIKKQPQKL